MRATGSQLLGKINVGNSQTTGAAMLLLFCFVLLPIVASCPACCLCASDIISCSGRNLSTMPSDLPSYATRLDLSHNALSSLRVDWIAKPFDRLATLVLNKNSISQIEVAAFFVTPHLYHLDLSSNQLTVLNASIFTGLRELKELLLIGNRIVQIEPGAFHDLNNLQRLYLSANRLTAFPLELYEEFKGPRNLTFLDLSRNRLSTVPVHRLLSLTRHRGIYLQNNPLICDCTLLALLEYWMWKRYRPLVDFKGEYACEEMTKLEVNCTLQGESDLPTETQTYQAEPGELLRVPCPGLSLPIQEGLVVFWVTPRTTLNSSSDPSDHLSVLPNGTLQIQGTLVEDSGTYECVVPRTRHYNPSETLEIRVIIGNDSFSSRAGFAHRGNAEHFNTAFTTLASCVVSIVLVLLYLYLTPCRCRGGRGGGAGGCGGRAIILCSDPRDVESGQQRSNGKRVAFLEPQVEDSICGPKTQTINSDNASTEGILKNGSRTVGQILTDPVHLA